jgi:hypothetical protein
MYKVQQAAHDSPKNAATYSAQRPEATGCVEIVYCSLTRGSNLDSRHVKCCLLAQLRRLNTQNRSPIFSSHEVGLLQRLADFLRHLAPPTGDCVVNSDSIHATLVSGPAETIELSAPRGDFTTFPPLFPLPKWSRRP